MLVFYLIKPNVNEHCEYNGRRLRIVRIWKTVQKALYIFFTKYKSIIVHPNTRLVLWHDGTLRDTVHDKENADLRRVEGRAHCTLQTRAALSSQLLTFQSSRTLASFSEATANLDTLYASFEKVKISAKLPPATPNGATRIIRRICGSSIFKVPTELFHANVPSKPHNASTNVLCWRAERSEDDKRQGRQAVWCFDILTRSSSLDYVRAHDRRDRDNI